MTIKSKIAYTFFAITLAITSQTNCNPVLTVNKLAYEMIAAAAYNYLDYKFTGDARNDACSTSGKAICKVLGNLAFESQSFNPVRDDLKVFARSAATAFRNFDFSGKMSDRKLFVSSLKNLLLAVRSLLTDQETDECNMLIARISASVQ